MSGADIQPSNKVDGLFVYDQNGPRHLTGAEYIQAMEKWRALEAADPHLFQKIRSGSALSDVEIGNIAKAGLNPDPGSVSGEVLRDWRNAQFGHSHQPQMMVQVNGALTSPNYLSNLADRADNLSPEIRARVMGIEDLSQLDRQTSQALKAVGIGTEELHILSGRNGILAKAADTLGDIGNKSGPVIGPAIAAAVGALAIASGASAGEAYEEMAETGAPFVSTVNAIQKGDQAQATREGINEITGWSGAAAGAKVGGAVAGIPGAIAGGIGGGVGGALVGDDIADTIDTRKSVFDGIKAEQNIGTDLSDCPSIIGSWAMISPFIENENLPFNDVVRSENGVITNYNDLDWTDPQAQEALQRGIHDALEAYKAALSEHGVVGEVMSWFDTNGNEQDELQLDVGNLEAAWLEVLRFQESVDRQNVIGRFVEQNSEVSISPWISEPESPNQLAFYNSAMHIEETSTVTTQLDREIPENQEPQQNNDVEYVITSDMPKL